MKKLLLLLLALFVVGGFFTTMAAPALAGPKVLKYASPYGVSNPLGTTTKWFGEELEKRTNGRYKVDYYWSGAMGKAPDLPTLCAEGVVDLIWTGLGYTPAIFRLSRVVELMYISENPYAQGAALWDMYHNYAPVRQEWEKCGLILGYPVYPGNMAVQTKAPVNTVADVKGLKARAYPAVAGMIERMGGIPVSMSYGEVYDALNRGMIKGAFGIPFVNIYGSRFWEVARYTVNTGVGGYGMAVLGVSKKTYEGFPPDVKKIFDQLRDDANAEHRRWMGSFDREVIRKILKEKFTDLIDWSPEEKAKARNLLVPFVWEAWLEEMKKANAPGDECLNTFRRLIKKYEAQYPYESPYDYYRSLKKGQ